MAESLAAELLEHLTGRGWSLGVAESLTGGLLTATVVEVPGTSAVLHGSVVAYTAAVKTDVLGVDPRLIERVGTVDAEVARQMAKGARRLLDADVALATTGVAGPGAGEGHPSGTVWLACDWPGGVEVRRLALTGGRAGVRAGAVSAALRLALDVT